MGSPSTLNKQKESPTGAPETLISEANSTASLHEPSSAPVALPDFVEEYEAVKRSFFLQPDNSELFSIVDVMALAFALLCMFALSMYVLKQVLDRTFHI